MLQVTVSGTTREDLIAKLAEWIDILGGAQIQGAQGPIELSGAAVVEGKKRGRPAKAAAVQEPPTMELPMEAQTVAPHEQATPAAPVTPAEQAAHAARATQAAQAAQAVPTLQSTIDALKGVAALRPGDTGPTDGYQRVSKILIKYGYKNVKEIKPEHFTAVIADCQGGV